jgi:16S rRNA G966 N2-methylase RsmD
VFCDPPYKLAHRLEPQLEEHLPQRLAKHGRLVLESSARNPLTIDVPKLELVDERRIGEALIRIYAKR